MPPFASPLGSKVQRPLAMPLKYSTPKRNYTRTKAYAALLVAFVVLSAAALFGVGVRAQRKNDNANQKSGASSSRRVIVGRGSDTAKGSRTTITADDSLNDYSAYRSGDRFYVVLPKSAAGSVAKGSGKGYSDVQVQQRGDSVVVSYKVQPGAKPRVEQKFNRLDVVFDVKEGGQAPASGQESSAQTQQQSGENRNASSQQQQQQQQQQATQPKASATAETPNDRRTAEAAPNTTQPGANNSQNNGAHTGETAAQTGDAQTQTAPTPAVGEQTPSTAPTAEPQIAQNQPPAPIAPITNPNSSATGAPTGTSFAATLINNWPIPLFVTLLVVGLGLVFFARRSSAQAPPAEVETATVATTTETATAKKKVEEPRATLLKEATPEADSIAANSATTVEAATPVKAAPIIAAAAAATGKKKKKKDRKGKNRGGRVEALPLVETSKDAEPSVAESLVEETPVVEPSVEPRVEETVAEETKAHAEETVAVFAPPIEEISAEVSDATSEETLVSSEETAVADEETTVAEVETPSNEVETASIEAAAPELEPAIVETHADASTLAVEDSTPAAVEAPEVEAPREVSIEPSIEAVEDSISEPPVESAIEPAAEPAAELAIEPVAESIAAPVTSIAPAEPPDPETVQAETRRLLVGGAYDRSVIGSEDSMARQLIGAELLSALAGRNMERRERARAAFLEHGYFEEKTRDVREAAAPAERAAAARSLGIVGDRAAAPHLISALEDDSMEVRRAAVEALGSLREPTAVEALEALMQRERNERNRIPSRIIQHAAETCRLAAVEEARAAAEPAQEVEETTQVKELTPVEEPASQDKEPASLVEEPASQLEEPSSQVGESAAKVEEPSSQVGEASTRIEEVATRAGEASTQGEDLASPVEEAASPAEVAPAAPVEETSAIEAVVEEQPAIEEEQPTIETQRVGWLEPIEESQTVEESHEEAHPVEVAHEEIQPFEEIREEVQPVEETLTFEEPSHASETSALAEPAFEFEQESVASDTLVAESNAVEPFFNEPQTFEPTVAEPHVTEETSAFAQESDLEPVAETNESFAPFVSSSEEASKADEWVELDMSDMGAQEAAPAAESIFESSSGETLEAEPEAHAPAGSFKFELEEETPAIVTHVETHEAEPAFESHRVEEVAEASASEFERADVSESAVEPLFGTAAEAVTAPLPSFEEKGVVPVNENSIVPAAIQQRLTSRDASVRASAITELSRVDTDEAFQQICNAFDDEAKEVRSAAARALYELRTDRAESFTRALREATPDRRRSIGAAVASSGLASEAISQLTGESRDRTYEAFSLLFLMAKAGEVQPLVRAIEGHPNNEVRLAVVKLLALSGQKEILPAFRRLAVRGSLPTEVRSAVMEAIYQISSSQPTTV